MSACCTGCTRKPREELGTQSAQRAGLTCVLRRLAVPVEVESKQWGVTLNGEQQPGCRLAPNRVTQYPSTPAPAVLQQRALEAASHVDGREVAWAVVRVVVAGGEHFGGTELSVRRHSVGQPVSKGGVLLGPGGGQGGQHLQTPSETSINQ